MQTFPLKSRLIKPKDDLLALILETLKHHHQILKNEDLLGIVSKAVSYSEDRLVNLKKRPLSYWIQQEADRVFGKNEDITLTLKNFCLIPNAGIDLSNAPRNAAILWPKDAFKTAQTLKKQLQRHFKIKRLGVLIVDSTCQPLRAGTSGRAIGWAGFEGVEDQRGKKDLYGKTMRVTQKAVADNLASTLLLDVGETNEQTPFVLFRNAPVRFTEKKATKKTAFFTPSECIFRSVYSREFLQQWI